MPTSSSTIRISRACTMRALDSGGGRGAGRSYRWKDQRDARAARRRVFHRDAAPVLVDDFLHDREAEPGALRFCSHVRLEDVLDHVVVEAGAVVGEREYRFAAVGRESDRKPRIRDIGLGIDGILQEIMEHLA